MVQDRVEIASYYGQAIDVGEIVRDGLLGSAVGMDGTDLSLMFILTVT